MIIFISYGTGGAEAINPVYNLVNSSGIPSLNISISEYTKNKLDNNMDISEENIINLIEKSNPSIVVNERSSGVEIQNKITKFCKEKGIFNCSILDFPGNYLERFAEKPDLIFVPSGEIKEDMLKLGFEKDKVYVSGNPSFDDLPYLNKERVLNNIKVLFISQPLLKYNIDNEFEVFDKFYIHLEDSFDSFKMNVKIHPQEDLKLWTSFLEKNYDACIVEDIDCDKYDLIVGYNSTVMYRSSYMNIPTIFYDNMDSQIKAYKNGLNLSNPASGFRENAAENIFNYLLNFV